MSKELQQSLMDNIQKENLGFSRIWGNYNPDDSHEFEECMEDWHNYAWGKELKDWRRQED